MEDKMAAGAFGWARNYGWDGPSKGAGQYSCSRIEQELLARIVSEMNGPVPDPTVARRTQPTPDSSVVSESEQGEEDADMLGEKTLPSSHVTP